MYTHHPYCRPLNTNPLIKGFFENVLQISEFDDNLINIVKRGEAESINYGKYGSTWDSPDHRAIKYTEDHARWELRRKIVSELYDMNRLNDDDQIKLGEGGARPQTDVVNEGKAYIVIGLPASGKSSIAVKIANAYGAYILDSDFAKRKIPEFDHTSSGASLVHTESNEIVFGTDRIKGTDFKPLFELCKEKKLNIVIPKIGHDVTSIEALASKLTESGYEVNLTLVCLDRRKATLRALKRYEQTKRYVPLSLVFDGYGNDPILTYFRLKEKYMGAKDPLIASFGKISTDTPPQTDPIVVNSTNGNPAQLFMKEPLLQQPAV